ncbi:unnamed protein product [Allacma fusca]|uniref:F-box domain-containing protein n=1 Tax=Allacma fusca TaxID=39272 RepID=A0A8J2KD77_9HEXA|nr:unnamed protein product [Allacma fusca]
MFEKMSLDALATARLVCRQWNGIASPYFQRRLMKSSKVVHLDSENWIDFVRTFDTRDGVFFWTKIILHGVPLKQMYPRNMFKNYGQRISHLTLINSNPENITLENFRHLLSFMKNLTSLCLGTLPEEISACSQRLFVPISENVDFTFPKLSKIRFHLTSVSYTHNFFDGLFTAAAPSLHSIALRETNSNFELVDLILRTLGPRSRTITSLKISQLNEQNLHILNHFALNNGMRLEKLSLESLSQEVTHTTVFELLSRHAPTLKSLLIGRPSACRSVFINFTFPFVMPYLNKLDFWTHSLEWGGIHYSRQLPRLQKIIVRAYKSFHNWTVPLPDARNIHPENRCGTVSTIVYLDEHQSTENQINIWKLYLMFPSVTRICIDINDIRTLHVFWTFWTTLEDLEIHLTRRCALPDVAFTGFSAGAVQEILSHLPCDLLGHVQPFIDQVPPNGLAKLPSMKFVFAIGS